MVNAQPLQAARARAVARGAAGLLLCILAPAVPAVEPGAQETERVSPLTEAVAIELALTREAYQHRLDAAAEEAKSNLMQARLHANPNLEFVQETNRSPAGETTERTVRVTQALDISGRRKLRTDAARLLVESADLDSASVREQTVSEVRRHFFTVLQLVEKSSAHERWLTRLGELQKIAEILKSGGEASVYDVRRVQREYLSAQASAAEAGAELEASRERLYAVIGPQGRRYAEISGSLVPPPAPPLERLQESLTSRPDLLSLRNKASAYRLEQRAARRLVLPDVTLGVGVKHLNDPAYSDTGLVFSLSLPLPLADRGQAAHASLGAKVLATDADYRLAIESMLGELRAARIRTESARIAAARLREGALPVSRDLVRIAELAYRAGEMTMLEVLDAHRALLIAEIEVLDLELRAALSRVELERLSGGGN